MDNKSEKYFEYCEKVNWNYNKISMYCNKNKLLLEEVLKLAKEYAYKYNIYTEKEIQIKIIHQHIDKNWLSRWTNKSKKRIDFYHQLGGGDNCEFRIKLLKECYTYCEKVDYDKNKLTELANIIDVIEKTIYEYVMEYYIYVLGNSIESWEIKNKEIKIRRNKESDKQKVDEYINFSEESRQLYEMLECTSYSDFIKKLPKFCYEYCESVEFDIDKVREYAKSVNISYQMFRYYACEYSNDKDFNLISNKESLTDNVKKMGLLKKWINSSEKRKKCYEYLGKGNYDEFKSKLIKVCYEYAESVNFDKDKLKELAETIDVIYPTLLSYIKKYAKILLEMKEEEIKKTMNPTNSDISDDIRVIKWIDNSEKREQLYIKLGSLPYEEFRIALYKKCYEYGLSVEFEKEKVETFAENIDISTPVVYSYMRKYAISVLKLEEQTWQKIRNRKLK